ncbi:site-specific integrase [Variovorax sp. J22P271]|uniref:tyrosine-type recombinase/integrase n=1 Tax=Variovorax davisae TaxID=3053515 RepID=UPI002577C89B|nr:site-specific integrase [Variovorax sp. J22P271]MDM0031227.1 site-specific integrase [Variovorax sp. J22P271]
MKKNAALSVKALKALEPGQSLSGEGLTIERLKSGDLRFKIATQINRERVSRAIGFESEGFTLDDARAVLASLRSRAREGALQLPVARKTGLLLSELAEIYLGRLEAGDGKNVGIKRAHFELHLLPHLGALPAASIDEHAFGGYRKKRRAEKVLHRERLTTDATVNRELSTLRHALNSGVRWKLIPPHALAAKPTKEADGTRGALNAIQTAKLLEAARLDPDADIHTFVMVAANTSARLSEVLRIKVGDIDFDRLRISIHEAKAGAREQPMPPILVEHLQDRIKRRGLKRTDWLFPSALKRDGTPKSKEGRRMSIASVWPRVIKAAGLTEEEIGHKLVRHSLRHTAITAFVKSGADLQVVQKMSGHKTLSMVMRYTHTRDAEIDLAMERMQALMAAGSAAAASPAPAAAAASETVAE